MGGESRTWCSCSTRITSNLFNGRYYIMTRYDLTKYNMFPIQPRRFRRTEENCVQRFFFVCLFKIDACLIRGVGLKCRRGEGEGKIKAPRFSSQQQQQQNIFKLLHSISFLISVSKQWNILRTLTSIGIGSSVCHAQYPWSINYNSRRNRAGPDNRRHGKQERCHQQNEPGNKKKKDEREEKRNNYMNEIVLFLGEIITCFEYF